MKIVLGFLLAATVCFGQHSSGYAFIGPATFNNSPFTYWQGTRTHLGLGGEGSVGSYVTLGGEIGGIFGSGAYNRSAALLSANPAVHFLRTGKVDPFVTGGFTGFVRNGFEPMWNIGGGANYWFRRHLGVRFEIRDHRFIRESGELHLTSFRVGLAFR